MNRFYLYLISSFLLLVSLEAQIISGNVKDLLTTQGLQSVMVEVTDLSSEMVDTLYTDPFGNWSYQITSVSDVPHVNIFQVDQNYPNPFNPSTNISFTINKSEKVNIIIHDILGRIVDSKEYALSRGSYRIKYEGIINKNGINLV